MRRMTFLKIACLTLLTTLSQMTQAQDFRLPISLPLPGFYVFPGAFEVVTGMEPDSLFKVDTESGEVQTLVSGERYITGLRISHNGQWAAYGTVANAFQFVQIPSGRLQTIRDPIPDAHHDPVGWSPGSDAVIFRSFNLSFPGSIYWLNQYDIQTKTLTRILELPVMSPLADALPAYANIASHPSYATYLKSVEVSPLDPNWIALGLDLTSYEVISTPENSQNTTDPDPNFWVEYLLWNNATGQVISITGALPIHLHLDYGNAQWRPNRLEFVVPISDDFARYQTRYIIFRLEPTASGDWQLRMIESSLVDAGIVDWIGIDDLFLIADGVDGSRDTVFGLGQIIGGQWHRRELFHLEYETFKESRLGDFHLTASPEEQQRLSCTFDVYLQTQVTLGSTIRSIGTDRLPLRTNPQADSDVIGSLAADSEATIIAGPACYDEMRWWQVRLQSGLESWLPEASISQFFIEPIR